MVLDRIEHHCRELRRLLKRPVANWDANYHVLLMPLVMLIQELCEEVLTAIPIPNQDVEKVRLRLWRIARNLPSLESHSGVVGIMGFPDVLAGAAEDIVVKPTTTA